MREIGGYIEFEHFRRNMLHEDAIALNCGRNALAYLFKSRGIKKLKIPFFICDSIVNICAREGVQIEYYHIDHFFKPEKNLILYEGEWLYLVNFYGQLSNDDIEEYVKKYTRVIVDQANGYFEKPISGVDTIYTCRKWFGVSDGAFLYTNKELEDELPMDVSFERMRFLLGRYERPASEFYEEYINNNKLFIDAPIKRMSLLTKNLLSAIDYDDVKRRRSENFKYLQNCFGENNQLKLKNALFMYPLMLDNGAMIRSKLQEKKIYIPTLWPIVFNITEPNDIENKMAENILPLPIDQRYGIDDMEYIVNAIMEVL